MLQQPYNMHIRYFTYRRFDGLTISRVHALRAEGVFGQRAHLRSCLDLREGVQLRHGQVRQEEGTRELQRKLRNALSGRKRIPLPVSTSQSE